MRYCILFDGKRSKAISHSRAVKIKQHFETCCNFSIKIVPYHTVKKRKIYDVVDLLGIII